MNKLFNILVFILIVEIILGYTNYLRDSSVVTGHYVSSIANIVNKSFVYFNKNQIEQARIQEAKRLKENLAKDKIRKALDEIKKLEQNKGECKNYLGENLNLKISGISSLRNSCDFQTDLTCLN